MTGLVLTAGTLFVAANQWMTKVRIQAVETKLAAVETSLETKIAASETNLRESGYWTARSGAWRGTWKRC
jgi:hypothetical protein